MKKIKEELEASLTEFLEKDSIQAKLFKSNFGRLNKKANAISKLDIGDSDDDSFNYVCDELSSQAFRDCRCGCVEWRGVDGLRFEDELCTFEYDGSNFKELELSNIISNFSDKRSTPALIEEGKNALETRILPIAIKSLERVEKVFDSYINKLKRIIDEYYKI